MKIVFLFLIAFLPKTYAWDAYVELAPDLSNVLTVNCGRNELLCWKLCTNMNICKLESADCRNCIGANTYLSHFYREVGRLFTNSGKTLPSDEILNLLKKKRLIYLTPHGAYNIYSALGDLRIEKAFNSLCPTDFDSMPVVLATLTDDGRIDAASHVICHGDKGADVYSLKHAGQFLSRLKGFLDPLRHKWNSPMP